MVFINPVTYIISMAVLMVRVAEICFPINVSTLVKFSLVGQMLRPKISDDCSLS